MKWHPATRVLAAGLVLLGTLPANLPASSHREAPITALDQKADITDWYAFVSPEKPDHVILIMNVDPFLEPSGGPNYFPFDPGILYEMRIDNDRDGKDDVTFQFRFKSEIRAPGVFTGFVGNLLGIPPITALDGPGSEGLNLRQSYTITMLTKGGGVTDLTGGKTLYAMPTNVGPRTMPAYDVLKNQAQYSLKNDIRVFAGTVADPFFIDLGAAFDSLNFRQAAGGGVLDAGTDSDDFNSIAPNSLAGYNVNTIVMEVPIGLLTKDAKIHTAAEADAVIGSWATTSRLRTQVLRTPAGSTPSTDTSYAQVQRLGTPLINELIIGTGSKDAFSIDVPSNDSQFASFFLDPLLAKIFASIGIPVPNAPRTDLLPLVTYAAPICPGCKAADAGPIADLLRLNTGIPPSAFPKHLGFLAGDTAGFPNGRRPVDVVVDIAARAVGGILANPNQFGTRIGDGVNSPATRVPQVFPFLSNAYSGRDSVHQGPGQTGCTRALDKVCATR